MPRYGQSRAQSWFETSTHVMVGYFMSLALQRFLFPIWNIHTTLGNGAELSAIFMMASLVRTIILRRIFNAVQVWSRTRYLRNDLDGRVLAQ